jgi:glycolate oxidase FAD binding subunit
VSKDLGRFLAEVPGAPDAAFVVAPATAADVAAILSVASREGMTVQPWGAGTHQGYGHSIAPDVVLAATRLRRIVAWEPDDLTVVTEAGATLRQIEEHLTDRRQTAGLPEHEPHATVGGVVAAGLSGWRRLRYGPTRDRVLETVSVTGDGRVIRGGARLVKNSTGYDLPRLLTGSFGSLGLIVQVCLKLWPEPEEHVTVTIDDPERAAAAYRPLAVIEDRAATRVYLGGTGAEVTAQAEALGGTETSGLDWPAPLSGSVRITLRVPAGLVRAACDRLPPHWAYQAAHGVGEIRAATDTIEPDEIRGLRDWAEAASGALAVATAPDDLAAAIDPWGTPPQSLPLQRRVKAAFDPAGIMNPGRLPGGL